MITRIFRLGFLGWIGLSLLASGGAFGATVGSVVPILGQPADLAYDATRKLLFVSNTTQNRIEVYSLDQGQLLAPIPVGRQPAGIAIVPEKNYLLVCNTEETFLTIIDLGTLTPISTIPVVPRSAALEFPFSVAVLSGDTALLSTNVGLQIVELAAKTTKPVPATGFTVSPNTVLIPSGNRKLVLGQSGGISFLYNPNPLFSQSFEQIRPISSSVLAVDAAGSRFMIGRAQFDTLLYQTAQMNPFLLPSPIGGIAFSADGTSVFVGTSQSPGARIHVLAASDLRPISSFQVPEPIVGKIIANPAGDLLFATSLSGVTVIRLSSLPSLPSLKVSHRILYFHVGLCSPVSMTQTVQITHTGGGSFAWKASTSVSGVTVEPAAGNGPSPLQVKLDPGGFAFRGTVLLGTLTITSEESVSGDQTIFLLLNLRTPDQIGMVFPVDGFLSDILLDEARNRLYLVNSSRDQIEVFSISRREFLPAIPVGSLPKSIAFTPDRTRLLVANLGAEFLTVLDAESLAQTSQIRVPRPTVSSSQLGSYPFSIAVAANGVIFLEASTLGSTNRGTIYRLNLAASTATALQNLGTSGNLVSGVTFLAASADGAFVFFAESGGTIRLYDATTGNFAISRSLGSAIAGNVAASSNGSHYHAANQLLSFVLVPVGPIPSGMTDVPFSIAGFAFGLGGPRAYRGIRPAFLSSGLPSLTPPRIEKLDTSALKLIAAFHIAEALVPPFPSAPFLAIHRQLVVDSSEATLYGLSDSGLMVMPLPSLTSPGSPQVNSGGVVNAASFASAPATVAPGSIAAVFGTNLAKSVASAETVPLPTVMGDVCVTFDGLAAPLFFASPEQLNVQVPLELAGRSRATVVVSSPGFASAPVSVSLSREAPGIFTISQDGQGPGAILHSSDFSPVSTSNPARLGEVISIFATGLGPTNPPIGTGLAAPLSGTLHQSATPTVTIGDVNASVLFSALAPGFVGLYQVNVRIPSNAPVGTRVSVVITLGNRTSNPATLAIVPVSP